MNFSWSNKRHDKQPQGPFRQQFRQRRGKQGQNMIEYMLIFAAAVAVMVVALNPKGFVTRAVSKSINMMFDSVEDMASEPCLGTIDDVDGGWSNWGSWGACAGCVQTRTRSCTNPSPKCGGAECTRADSSLTSPTNRSEAETQSCLSGTWVTGACGVCTGSCGSTVGTCTRLVTCPSGCCAPPAPVSVMSCTKPEYPDVWSGLGFGACSTTCDKGIASQVVTCSGMCCDALLKPPTRQACTDGCCARTMDIGLDIVNNVQFTASFGPAANGQPFSVSCPSGYAGNPTSTCTATANLSCTGNDSYVPPASCYNISWGPVSNTCVPADCSTVSVDAGYGRMWDVPFTLHGNTATLNCSDGGWSYTGTASYDCWLGAWQNLSAGCIPNCLQVDNVFIGAGLYVTFPETVSGGSVNLACSSYDAGLAPGQKKYVGSVSRSCSVGTWSGITGTCDFKPCGTQYILDPNSFVLGTFPASSHGTPYTVTCSDVDSKYTGTFTLTCTYGDWMYATGGCTAKPCSDWTTNVGGVNITFSAAPHGTVQPQNCSDFDNTYTGTVTAECNFGNWINLSGGCTPNCPTQNLDIGSGLTGSFAEIASGQTRYATCPGGYSGTPNRLCSAGTWGSLNNGCTPNACINEYLGIGAGQGGWFYAAVSGTTRTLSCPSGYSGSPTRTCTAGSWGSLSNGCVCVPACPPASCGNQNDGCGGTIWCGNCPCLSPCGYGTISSGSTNTCYKPTAPCGSLCSSIVMTATCNNGSWSVPGFATDYTYSYCSIGSCANCTGPDGATIWHNSGKIYYQSNFVTCGSNCVAELRDCFNGTLSGSYQYPTCQYQTCTASCGFTVAAVVDKGQNTTTNNNQSLDMCTTFTVQVATVAGAGCGNPGTPGSSCTVTVQW